jgi:hypothetical protein
VTHHLYLTRYSGDNALTLKAEKLSLLIIEISNYLLLGNIYPTPEAS